MPLKFGPKEAAKMLVGLDPSSQKKLLDIIKQKDPKIAAIIEQNMLTIDDLIYLTPQMILELSKLVPARELGLALRIAPADVQLHLLKYLPRMIREEADEYIKKPQLVSKVNEAHALVMTIIREKIQKGEFVLRSENDHFV